MTRTILTLCLAAMLGSCTLRHGDFTLMATRNIDVSRIGEFERGPRVEGENMSHIIVFIPTVLQPNIEDAIENAIDKVPGAVGLTDVVVRQRAFWFIYGQAGWLVEGTALVDPRMTGLAQP